MKRGIFFLGILLVGLFLVNGQGCSQTDAPLDGGDTDSGSDNGGNDVVPGAVTERNVLVDRVRMVTGGNPPYDLLTTTFPQDEGKGIQVETTSEKEVMIEVIDAKGCIEKTQGGEYTVIKSGQGTSVSLVIDPVVEDTIQCVAITALEDGQIDVNLKVTELVF